MMNVPSASWMQRMKPNQRMYGFVSARARRQSSKVSRQLRALYSSSGGAKAPQVQILRRDRIVVAVGSLEECRRSGSLRPMAHASVLSPGVNARRQKTTG